MQLNDIWHQLFLGVLGNAIWASIAFALAGLYWATKHRSRYSGRWSALINWTHEWAKSHLTGRDCPDAHSRGEIALSYGSGEKRNQYWGLGVWELRDGSDDLAELCVEFHTFEIDKAWSIRPPFVRHTLKSCLLTSRIRHELGTFQYAKKFANYEVVFSSAEAGLLVGIIQARTDASKPSSVVVVGQLRATRVS
jgi:hypothetical protein